MLDGAVGTVAAVIYVAGCLVAFVATDAGWPTRAGLAIIWPLGPLAFLATASLLLMVSLVAFPLVGLSVLAGAALLAAALFL